MVQQEINPPNHKKLRCAGFSMPSAKGELDETASICKSI